jgi:hypothetical protein
MILLIISLLQYASVAMSKRPAATIPSLMRCPSRYYGARGTHVVAASTHISDGTMTSRTVATVEYVAHARLLLAPIAVTGSLTSTDRCYCWTRGTRAYLFHVLRSLQFS